MKARDVMTDHVECISPDATLQEAAAKMKAMDVGSLPICEKDRLAGMITDRDIILRSVAEGRDPKMHHVRDAMTRDVIFCFDDQNVEEVGEVMSSKQVRRLPILDRNKRLVGIVSLGDLAIETGDEELAGHALEAISEPAFAMNE